MESSSFSGSSKRAKAPGAIAQVAHCLVDGCSADLSQCRDYHRRHKVCEVHSKTPKVTIGGREQRFCQQCSRFHSLVEFDEGKRSCRKRLDGHNRRRRKPQPEPRLDLSRQQAISGTRVMSFSAPQILPSSVVGYSWSDVVKAENEIGVVCNNQQQQQQLSYMDAAAHSYKGVMNEVQLVQGSSDGSSVCHQPFVDPIGGGSRQRMVFSDGLNECDGALSLLSSATPPLVDYNHYHLPLETKPIAAASTLHFPEMFHHAPEGPSTPGCGSHQTLSFMWE